MKVSDKGLALIKDVEGLKSFPLLDFSRVDSLFLVEPKNPIHNFAGV